MLTGDSLAAGALVDVAVRQLRAAARLLEAAEEFAHRQAQIESAIAILVSLPAPPSDPTPSERTVKGWDTRRVLYGRRGHPPPDPRQ
jgi:hypothetical protein